MGITKKDELTFALYVTLMFMVIILFIGYELMDRIETGKYDINVNNYIDKNIGVVDSTKNELYNVYTETTTKDGLNVCFDMKLEVNYELSYYQLQSIKTAFKDVMSNIESNEIIRSQYDFTYKYTFSRFLSYVSANPFFKGAFQNVKISDIILECNITCQKQIF